MGNYTLFIMEWENKDGNVMSDFLDPIEIGNNPHKLDTIISLLNRKVQKAPRDQSVGTIDVSYDDAKFLAP